LLLVELRQRYPDVFISGAPKPLKIGIHRDLYKALPEISNMNIRRFLHWWTGRRQYKAALKAAESTELPRYDLRGLRYPYEPEEGLIMIRKEGMPRPARDFTNLPDEVINELSMAGRKKARS